MIITKQGNIISDKNCTEVCLTEICYKNLKCYFQGVVFCRGLKAGEESVKAIIDDFIKFKNILFSEIYGAFIMIIKDLNSEQIILFSDNSNMRSLYIGNKGVSNDFLELVKYQENVSFDKKRISEFLSLGTVYFRKTIVKEIYMSDSQKYYLIHNNKISEFSKNIGNIDEISNIDHIDKFFEDIAYAIKDRNITLDLTGGYDSRMVYAELKNHIPNINIFISGPDSASDVIVAKKIAKKENKQIDRYIPGKPKITEDYLYQLFRYNQTFLSFNSSIRMEGFTRYRKQKGYNIRVTGDGGVLHKDWWWIQDFPFYNKKKVDLNRFYRQRIYLIEINAELFTEEIKKYFETMEEYFINNISRYKKETNTQTYDMLYYNVSGSKLSKGYNISSNILDCYAPLWEIDLVRYSYRLPRKKRFYYNFIREVTTRNAPEIAKVRTVYGLNASSKKSDKIIDTVYFIKEYFTKVMRLFRRKFLNKNVASDVDIWSPYEEIKSLEVFDDAVQYFKDQNVLNNNIKKENIPDLICDRLLLIYMINKYCGGKVDFSD